MPSMGKLSNKMTKNQWLLLEYCSLFLLLPALLSVLKVGGVIYFIMWLVTSICIFASYRYHSYKFGADWNIKALNNESLRVIFIRFFPLAAVLAIFTYINVPERFFGFPLERPQTWAMVMIWYPILSVLPQEFIYRSFFFARYKTIFSSRWLVLVSSLSFGWVHIILQNWVAVIFCTIGGFIFATTYKNTKSLAAVTLEHSLYGCWIFTLGLGVYFYHGLAVK